MGYSSVPVGIPIIESASTQKAQFNDALSAWPLGLANAVRESAAVFPVRMWIVDDSGSMMASDGRRMAGGKLIKCTRAQELATTVKVQAELAVALQTRVDFHLLNGPSKTVDGQADSYAAQLADLNGAIGDGRASGGTPLTESVQKVIASVSLMAPSLQAEGKRALVVIATDGHPNNATSFVEAMKQLQALPVSVVVGLFTTKESVTSYWSSLDKELERPLEVLDDVVGEAEECAKVNPFLTYGAALQEAREFGLSHKLFDVLDEAPLLPTQAKTLLELLFGCRLPEPEVDWAAFRSAVESHCTSPVFDAISLRPKPWVDLASLDASFGPKLQLQLRGEKLKKLDFFSESDPFVRVVDPDTGRVLAETEHIDNNANPVWRELSLPLPTAAPGQRICMKFVVYDYNKSQVHGLIGSAEVHLDALLAGKVRSIDLVKDGKSGGRGRLVVESAS